MNVERAILIAFLGNYLVNTVVAALVAFVPAGGVVFTIGSYPVTWQYVSFVVLAAIVIGLLAWWYMCKGHRGLQNGLIFGAVGFVVAIATAFVTGVAGVLAQTGSLSAVIGVLPNFWPFLANWSTAVLFGYWVIPAAAVGWYLQPKATAPASTM